MSQSRKHTKEAIKQRGEVFTPTPLVREMLDKLPESLFYKANKTFLDNSCGDGQFLFEVLMRKLSNGISLLNALDHIYGIEIDPKNAEACRLRLLMGSEDTEFRKIVNHNIICADALDPDHPGWKEVGYMWGGNAELEEKMRKLREVQLEMFKDEGEETA